MFDFIEIPSDSSDCSFNYLSIASEKKQNEYYKLCGSKKGVKLITTYNNVLIIKSSTSTFSGGFSLIYKIITDPSSCKFILKTKVFSY